MPRNSSQWVTHMIGGGWATDYGSTYYATPENGSLVIPWLNKCENIRFYPDGSFGKYPGLDLVNTTPIKSPQSSGGYAEDSTVRHIYNFVRTTASVFGTSYNMAVVGSSLYTFGFSTVTRLGDLASSSNIVHHMSAFNDLLIVGGPVPKSWDATTFQTLAGAPPAFQFSTPHAGRHWAAGAVANPSRLYYSAVGNPEDWVGAGSGSTDIDPGDGDSIVAILAWKRELWVFKGPNRLSIHRISGTTTTDFTRTLFITGVSAAGPSSLFSVGDDFAFWSPRGSCHSLTATDKYGDYVQSYVNFPLLSWFRNPSNISVGSRSFTWQAMTDRNKNFTYCIFNNNVAGDSNAALLVIMDWNFVTESNPYPRFIKIPLATNFSAVSLNFSISSSTQLIPTFGNQHGHILQEAILNAEDYVVETPSGVATYPYAVETPSLTYGPTVYQKTITAVSVDITKNFNTLNAAYGSLDFSYGGRGVPGQTVTFANTGGIGLGSFVLGTHQLGSVSHIPNFYEDINGESSAFTYTLVEDSPISDLRGTDTQVKHFGVLITPSGESMENS